MEAMAVAEVVKQLIELAIQLASTSKEAQDALDEMAVKRANAIADAAEKAKFGE